MSATTERSDVATFDVVFRAVDAGSAVEERAPEMFATGWPAYRRWFLRDGEGPRATYLTSRNALRTHLPELVPTYERLVDAVGGGDLEARFLSHWCPPPLFAACSMAAWTRGDERVLLRNYDYPPVLCDTTVLRSNWNGTGVLAMSDCVIGALDGVNEHGLAVAISFGGRPVVGEGFGIGIVVRYLLEFAQDVPSAVEMLQRIPVQLAYNVSLVDRAGRHSVVYISPDRPATVTDRRTCGNRQGETEWPAHAEYCGTEERERVLAAALTSPEQSLDGLVDVFLTKPVHRPTAESTWGTIYTAIYDSVATSLDLRWHDDHWRLALDDFAEGERHRTELLALPPEPPMPEPVTAHEPPLMIV